MNEMRRVVGPLRSIFWGGLLCLFDFTVSETRNGVGFKFDLLNDALGMILITGGLVALARMPSSRRIGPLLLTCTAVAAVGTFVAITDHWVAPRPAPIPLLKTAFALVELAAVVVFCVALRTWARDSGLPRSAASWTTTLILFVLLVVLPLGVLQAVFLVAMLTGSSFSFNLGPAGLVVLAVFALPFIHFFVSTSRMAREAEESA